VDKKLNISQRSALAAQKANRILDCIQSGGASREREGAVLLCSVLVRLHLEYCISDLGAPAQERCGAVGVGPEEGHKDDQRAEAPLL